MRTAQQGVLKKAIVIPIPIARKRIGRGISAELINTTEILSAIGGSACGTTFRMTN